ncbi:MAG TPA: aquaporin, partial [Bacillota bacterium]|nr:aquaporin [Bacillota bacterium]
VYAGGYISGGHYNPAVTLGVWVRGRCPTSDLLPYWLAQFIGAALAAMAVDYLKGPASVTPMALKPGPALLAEFLFTFALVYVVLNSATAKANEGNSFYGLAIGFTVMIGAFAVGSITSAAFNPAVALGISMLGLSTWSNLWVYFVANLCGGLAAGLVFNLLNRAEKKPTSPAPLKAEQVLNSPRE